MEELSQTQKRNRNPKINDNNGNNSDEKKRENAKSEYEFCKVCNLNHNQGQRHKYFPSHKGSLSAFLSRFQSKFYDVRFFLKNPTLLRLDLASRNRLWCIFCDSDIDELGSIFACCNAINHLASADHLKKLKHFLWKYGGGMDRLETFRISEIDVAKWEKKCKALESDAVPSSEGTIGPAFGPSNEMSIRYPIQDSLKSQMLACLRMMLALLYLQRHSLV